VFFYAVMCSIRSCHKALRNISWDTVSSDGIDLVRNDLEKRRWANKI